MPTTRPYSPLPPMIPAEDIFWTNSRGPRVPAPCPHTYGVRVCSCDAFATEPCRPTACTQHATPAPYPSSDHCSLLTAHWTHTFSAKERDAETGLSYFGARYYSSDLSIWLSVDPQAAKYPSLSPYVYCADNPVKLVDPNGEEWYVNQDGNIVEGTKKDDHTLYAVKGKKNEFGDKLIYRRGDQKGKEIPMPVDDEIMRSFKTDENGYSQIIRL